MRWVAIALVLFCLSAQALALTAGNATVGNTSYPFSLFANKTYWNDQLTYALAVENDSDAIFATGVGATLGVYRFNGTTMNRTGFLALGTASPLFYPYAIAFDPSKDTVYLSTYSAPISVFRINASTMTVIDNLTLASGENYVSYTHLDRSRDLLYLLTTTTPARIIRVNTTSFTRLDNITLNSGENSPGAFIPDPSNDFAYVMLQLSPSRVIRINTTSFLRNASLTLASGENSVYGGAIDSARNVLYVSTAATSAPARIVRVNLTNFSRMGSLNLSSLDPSVYSLVHAPDDVVYAGTARGTRGVNGTVVRINASTFTVMDNITLSMDINGLRFGKYHSGHNAIYYTLNEYVDALAKVDLTSSTGTSAVGERAYGRFLSLAVHDGEVDIITSYDAPYVLRLNATTFATIATTQLNTSQTYGSFAFDGHGTIIAASWNQPVSEVVFLDSASLAEINRTTFPSTTDSFVSVRCDSSRRICYAGLQSNTGVIYAFNATNGGMIGNITLASGERYVYDIAIDEEQNIGYATSYLSPGRVLKINLTNLTRIGNVTFNSGENTPEYLAIDPVRQMGYAQVTSGRIVRFNLTNLTRMGVLSLTGTPNIFGICLDTTTNTAYVAASASIHIIDLTSFTETAVYGASNFSLAGFFECQYADGHLYTTLFGSDGVAKFRSQPYGSVTAWNITIDDTAVVESVSLYSHAASGAVRAALYDASDALVWESAATADNASADNLTLLVSAGSPSSLTLSPGTYRLAVQTNTSVPTLSYVSGTGVAAAQPYGAFPASLAGARGVAEQYSGFIAYSAYVAPPADDDDDSSSGGGVDLRVRAGGKVTQQFFSGNIDRITLTTGDGMRPTVQLAHLMGESRNRAPSFDPEAIVLEMTARGAQTGAEIAFSVPAGWHGAAPEDVRMFRYTDGWVALPTTYLGVKNGEQRYSALTPGFSFFAIGVVEPTPAKAVPAPETPVPAAPLEAPSAPEPVVGPVIAPIVAPTPEPEPRNYLWMGVAVVATMALLLLAFKMRKE
jgi:hypothetical protein